MLTKFLAWFWSRMTRILTNEGKHSPWSHPDNRHCVAMSIEVQEWTAPAIVLEIVHVQFTTAIIKVFP